MLAIRKCILINRLWLVIDASASSTKHLAFVAAGV